MLKSSFFIIICILFWIINGSFASDNSVSIPSKKIAKSIEKIWKVEDYDFIELSELNNKNCLKRSEKNWRLKVGK